MYLKKSPKHQQGFALIFAIFLTVGLEAIAAGSLLHMMRQTREIQRQADSVRLTASAEAVIDRGLRLMKAYVLAKNAYPNADSEGNVLGNNFSEIGNQTFSQFLSNWYANSFRPHFTSDPSLGLNAILINPSDIKITEIETGTGDAYKRYWIQVTAHSQYGATQKVAGQQIWLQLGQLFNFSVFSNEMLEITPGPSMNLQGPIFSNKPVYLFTGPDETLSLVKASNFHDAGNPEPYILNSASSIYYYFPAILAKNYMLENQEYRETVSEEYIDGTRGAELTYSSEITNLTGEMYPPKFYTINNGLNLWWADHHIQAQSSTGSGFTTLTHLEQSHLFYWFVGIDLLSVNDYTNAGEMNYSKAYDPNHPPKMLPDWTPLKPSMSFPPINPNWLTAPVDTVADQSHGIVERTIPIGDEDHPSGPHVLIEPLTSLFPINGPLGSTTALVEDTEAVATQKFQSKANLNIYHQPMGNPSADYAAGISQGWISPAPVTIFDYRLNQNLQVIQINIGQLLTMRPDLANAPNGLMIYVHGYAPSTGYNGAYFTGPHGVKLVNARRIPKNGLTVVTNGTLFVQGNFNDYSYSAGYGSCEYTVFNFDGCYGSKFEENKALWDSEDWHVPPAFLAADRSIIFLSEQWIDPYGRSGQTYADGFQSRPVSEDHMVNAAIVAGIIPSGLSENYRFCVNDISQVGCEVTPHWNAFVCPDNSYVYGQSGVSASCQYYQDPITKIYYVNRNSNDFQQALTEGLTDAAPWVEIPIFFKPESFQLFNGQAGNYEVLEPVRGLIGTRYQSVWASELFDHGTPDTVQTVWVCTEDPNSPPVACPGVPGDECAQGYQCLINGGGEQGAQNYCSPASICSLQEQVIPGQPPDPHYNNYGYSDMNLPLYGQHYSGGLENFINLQENWGGRTLRYSGSMAIPWTSKWIQNYWDQVAYYNLWYYAAPNRKFDYNEDFQEKQPPGTPGVFQLRRERIQS